MPNKRWEKLNTRQKGAILLSIAVQLGLLATAGEIRGGKRLWTAAAFVNYVGPISYFLFGRRG